MHNAAADETCGQILEACAAAGFQVSRAQLHRWQQADLLPRPRQQGLGKARGTRVLYPAGTRQQLIQLCLLQRKERSLDCAFWRLWWSGGSVPTEQIRRLLVGQLAWIRKQRQGIEALDHSEGEAQWQTFERVERDLGRARAHPILRKVRRRLGFEDFVSFSLRGLKVGTGFLDLSEADYDSAIFARKLGLERKSDKHDTVNKPELDQEPHNIVRRVFHMLDPDRLNECLTSSSNTELERARDDLRKLPWIQAAVRAYVAAQLGPKNVFDRLLSGVGKLSLKVELHFFLLWLWVRHSPKLTTGFQSALEEVRLFAPENEHQIEEK
jgi:hypothetical protein